MPRRKKFRKNLRSLMIDNRNPSPCKPDSLNVSEKSEDIEERDQSFRERFSTSDFEKNEALLICSSNFRVSDSDSNSDDEIENDEKSDNRRENETKQYDLEIQIDDDDDDDDTIVLKQAAEQIISADNINENSLQKFLDRMVKKIDRIEKKIYANHKQYCCNIDWLQYLNQALSSTKTANQIFQQCSDDSIASKRNSDGIVRLKLIENPWKEFNLLFFRCIAIDEIEDDETLIVFSHHPLPMRMFEKNQLICLHPKWSSLSVENTPFSNRIDRSKIKKIFFNPFNIIIENERE